MIFVKLFLCLLLKSFVNFVLFLWYNYSKKIKSHEHVYEGKGSECEVRKDQNDGPVSFTVSLLQWYQQCTMNSSVPISDNTMVL